MKKPLRLFLTAFLLTALFVGVAHGEALTVEADLPYNSVYTYMLRSGDALHCLSIGFKGEYARDVTSFAQSMAAQCSKLENGALVPCEDRCADFFHDRVVPNDPGNNVLSPEVVLGMVVTPENRAYMIDRDWTVYLWTPGEPEPWRPLCALDTTGFDFEFRVTRELFTASGDTLLGSFIERMDGEDTRSTVFAFSLTDGSRETLFTMNNIDVVYPAGGTRVLLQGSNGKRGLYGYQTVMYLYDWATGEKTLFTEEIPMGLVPDGQGGWYGFRIGYKASSLAHYGAEGGEGEQVAQLPSGLWESEVSLSGDGATAYVCSLNGTLILCPLTAEEDGPPVLTIAGSVREMNQNANALPDMTAFLAAHGGAQIVYADYPASFDDLAMELVSGSDRFDLMALELSEGNVDSLLDKGYYVDLSGDESIASFVENLYPAWQAACVRGEAIVGVPVSMRNVWTFMVNLEVWEEEGLGELPKTYDELFDCIVEWDDMGILDEVPLFERSSSSFSELLERIMIDYMGKCKREGRPIVFQDETLLRLLARLQALRPILDAHDARNITGSGLLFEGSLSNVVNIVYLGSHRVGAEDNTFAPLPLGLTGAEDCVESVYFTVLVVNPNSRRQELARAYLAYLAENPTTWARCYLLQNGPLGVRSPGYEELDAQYEQRMTELNENLAAAMQEGDDAVIRRWEQEKQNLTDEYLNMWEVRPNMAAMAYRMMPYFTPLTADGYGFLLQSGDDLTAMLLEGKLDARTYLTRLDERMRMMELEGH